MVRNLILILNAAIVAGSVIVIFDLVAEVIGGS